MRTRVKVSERLMCDCHTCRRELRDEIRDELNRAGSEK